MFNVTYILIKFRKTKDVIVAQVPENIGCNNPECIAKDECKRQVIARDKTAVEVKSFGGTAEKKCGKFLAK